MSYVFDFEFTDGEYKDISVKLEPAFGKQVITSIPEEGADVYLDGRLRGKTPFTLKECLSGTYIVEIKKDDYLKVLDKLFTQKRDKVTDKNHFVRKTKIANFLIQRGFESFLVWEKMKDLKDK